MLASEKLAIAAHLHVLLRRKTGRVTDTEWMAANTEYATEIVRFARAKAEEDGHPELAEWAEKLERATLELAPKSPSRASALGRLPLLREPPAPASTALPSVRRAEPPHETTGGFMASVFGESGFTDSTQGDKPRRERDPNAPRYVGGIR